LFAFSAPNNLRKEPAEPSDEQIQEAVSRLSISDNVSSVFDPSTTVLHYAHQLGFLLPGNYEAAESELFSKKH